MTRRVIAASALLALLLAGCSSTPESPSDSALASLPDAIPKVEPPSRYGNPASYVVHGQRYYVMDDGMGFVQRGLASWYGKKFHGRRTSSGEPYDMYAMTAAHKQLPLPSYVEVTNLNNQQRIVVRVNDRGPFVDDRIIDLSYAAAVKLDMIESGTAPVRIRVLTPDPDRASTTTTAAATPPSAQTTATPATTGATDYYVQVGAFRDPANAYRLQGRLLAADLTAPVQVQETTQGPRRLYRVRLGPVSDAAAADRLAATLTGHGIATSRVVPAERRDGSPARR